jgi:hypothetical protein
MAWDVDQYATIPMVKQTQPSLKHIHIHRVLPLSFNTAATLSELWFLALATSYCTPSVKAMIVAHKLHTHTSMTSELLLL